MRRTVLLAGLVALVLGLLTSSAQALTYVYAQDLAWDAGTGVAIGGSRGAEVNALGAPDGLFLSLGMGGMAVFDFGTDFDATAIVFETTYGNRTNYQEYAGVYVANALYDFASPNSDALGQAVLDPSDFTFVANINNQVEQSVIDLTGVVGSPFRYVLVVDTTGANDGTQGDGFDINAVGVSPVPEPATLFLLGTGLVGVAGYSRRRRSGTA